MTTSLTEFLAARIDEDEAAAEAALRGGTGCWALEGNHIILHNPARMLREVQAKRAILARHAPSGNDLTDCMWCSEDNRGYRWPCPDVLSLAAVYSGHPDYRQEWAP